MSATATVTATATAPASRYSLRSTNTNSRRVSKATRNPEKTINGSRKKRTSPSTATAQAQVVAALMNKTVNSTAAMPTKAFFDDNNISSSSSSSKDSNTTNNNNNKDKDIMKRSKSESDGEPCEVKNASKLITKYSVDPYDYSHDQLVFLSVEIFKYYHLLEIFQFNESVAGNFFYAVKDLYRTNNDFHNFRHAWGVMHMCFQILLHGADQHLEAFDILAVLVAAICHDVGHPGNNNAFELAINSDVSKKYAQPNEVCVLEKYHASETQSLLSKKATRNNNSNILVSLTEEEKQKFFNQVKFIILGTDMAKHSQLVEEAKELINQIVVDYPPSSSSSGSTTTVSASTSTSASTSVMNSPASSEISLDACLSGSSSSKSKKLRVNCNSDRETVEKTFHRPKVLLPPDVRLSLIRIIVHTADIGAQTQQLRIATKWAERVYNEFRSQAEKERALGIVTSPFIHQLSEDYMIYTSQASFIQDIVTPIWHAVYKLLPKLEFAVEQLESNKKYYQEHGESLKTKGIANANKQREKVSISKDGDDAEKKDQDEAVEQQQKRPRKQK